MGNEDGLIHYNKFMRLISSKKKRDINDELVSRHFLTNDLRDLLEIIEKLRNNSKENKIMVNLTDSRLTDWFEKGN